MSRQGRCRCGNVLVFKKTSQGYKVRCPSCHAVVRLRAEEPAATVGATPIGSLDDLEIRITDAPHAGAELPAFRDPAPRENTVAGWLLWAVLGLTFLVVSIGIAVVYAN